MGKLRRPTAREAAQQYFSRDPLGIEIDAAVSSEIRRMDSQGYFDSGTFNIGKNPDMDLFTLRLTKLVRKNLRLKGDLPLEEDEEDDEEDDDKDLTSDDIFTSKYEMVMNALMMTKVDVWLDKEMQRSWVDSTHDPTPNDQSKGGEDGKGNEEIPEEIVEDSWWYQLFQSSEKNVADSIGAGFVKLTKTAIVVSNAPSYYKDATIAHFSQPNVLVSTAGSFVPALLQLNPRLGVATAINLAIYHIGGEVVGLAVQGVGDSMDMLGIAAPQILKDTAVVGANTIATADNVIDITRDISSVVKPGSPLWSRVHSMFRIASQLVDVTFEVGEVSIRVKGDSPLLITEFTEEDLFQRKGAFRNQLFRVGMDTRSIYENTLRLKANRESSEAEKAAFNTAKENFKDKFTDFVLADKKNVMKAADISDSDKRMIQRGIDRVLDDIQSDNFDGVIGDVINRKPLREAREPFLKLMEEGRFRSSLEKSAIEDGDLVSIDVLNSMVPQDVLGSVGGLGDLGDLGGLGGLGGLGRNKDPKVKTIKPVSSLDSSFSIIDAAISNLENNDNTEVSTLTDVEVGQENEKLDKLVIPISASFLKMRDQIHTLIEQRPMKDQEILISREKSRVEKRIQDRKAREDREKKQQEEKEKEREQDRGKEEEMDKLMERKRRIRERQKKLREGRKEKIKIESEEIVQVKKKKEKQIPGKVIQELVSQAVMIGIHFIKNNTNSWIKDNFMKLNNFLKQSAVIKLATHVNERDENDDNTQKRNKDNLSNQTKIILSKFEKIKNNIFNAPDDSNDRREAAEYVDKLALNVVNFAKDGKKFFGIVFSDLDTIRRKRVKKIQRVVNDVHDIFDRYSVDTVLHPRHPLHQHQRLIDWEDFNSSSKPSHNLQIANLAERLAPRVPQLLIANGGIEFEDFVLPQRPVVVEPPVVVVDPPIVEDVDMILVHDEDVVLIGGGKASIIPNEDKDEDKDEDNGDEDNGDEDNADEDEDDVDEDEGDDVDADEDEEPPSKKQKLSITARFVPLSRREEQITKERERILSLRPFFPTMGFELFSEQEDPQAIKMKMDNLCMGMIAHKPLGELDNKLVLGNYAREGLRYMGQLNQTPTYYTGGSLLDGDKLYGTVRTSM